MTSRFLRLAGCAALVALAGLMAACASGVSRSVALGAPIRITVTGPNPVSIWNEIATDTINVAAASTGTPEEQRPIISTDLATVHIAIYDAVVAITGTGRPFAVQSVLAAPGTEVSQPAAVGAAAYGVLKALFPNRSAQYQPAWDSFVAGIGDGAPKARGLQLGAEIATGVVALRANDGRSVALAAYVPGTVPGTFRGTHPINRFYSSVRPFSLKSASQFRPPPPPALDSAPYARDFDETRLLGGTMSAARSPAQLEIARFHTEPPPRFWPRNLRNFVMTDRSLEDHARLMAMLTVAQADAEIGCFEAKYHYDFWRPLSAIPLAATDGNDETRADAAWTPVVPTPNHPEYPAAHACVAGAITEVLKAFYGTDSIAFSFNSTTTHTTHDFEAASALVNEIRDARIDGGMHFRNSLVRGDALGVSTAQQMLQSHFRAR